MKLWYFEQIVVMSYYSNSNTIDLICCLETYSIKKNNNKQTNKNFSVA